MGITLWTEDEIKDLSIPWLAFSIAHPGRTYKAWWNKKHSSGTEIEFVDRNMPFTDDQIDAYVDKLIEANKAAPINGGQQCEATINIQSDLPIGIAFTGDWHVGMKGTDIDTLRKHNKIIASTPGLFVVGMGDYYHNAKAGNDTTGNALYKSNIPDPDEQKMIAFRELRRFKDKILALNRGCHDTWDFKSAGINSIVDVCHQLETVCLWHGGVLHLTVGKTRYELLTRHKYGGKGKQTTAAQTKAYDDYPEDERLDVVALAHFHFNDLQQKTRGATRKVVYLRSGTYFIWDEYGQQVGGYRGEIGVPIIILYPNSKKIVPFEGSNFEQAIDYLGHLRAGK